MTVFADTHTHLYLDAFDGDREEVIDRAIHAGVNYMFLPNIDASSIRDLGSVLFGYPERIFGMMGLHPTSVKADYREQIGMIEMELHEHKERYCAIGEIGIDLYWDKTFATEQEDVFVRQLELALEFDLPAIIHTRNSMDIALGICSELRAQESGQRARSTGKMATSQLQTANCKLLRGVFHCFSGNIRQAEQAIGLGFKLGIGGVVTFKNSELQEVVKNVPLDQLLLETDAPFLAPVPFRGKRNEPAYIPLIAEKLAEIKQVSVEEVAEVTTRNALEMFGIKAKN